MASIDDEMRAKGVLPCPRCGTYPGTVQHQGSVEIACRRIGCGYASITGSNYDSALRRWNHRGGWNYVPGGNLPKVDPQRGSIARVMLAVCHAGGECSVTSGYFREFDGAFCIGDWLECLPPMYKNSDTIFRESTIERVYAWQEMPRAPSLVEESDLW